MARSVTLRRKAINTGLAWSVGLLIFFPILWTILTSFKTEGQAIADPPIFLFFDWTLENYAIVQERSDYLRFLWNSIIIAGGSTLLGILIAVPAAWSMAFVPSRRTKDILLWMLSTKMLPAVGVLYPIYLLFIQLGLLDTRFGLTVVLMLINLPIIVWMLYTYFKEIPVDILEAAADGWCGPARRDPVRSDPDGHSRYRLRQSCSISSWLGTKRSGPSILRPQRLPRSRPSSPATRAPKACFMRNSLRPRPWPLRQS